jgi:hypothetical protein
MSVALCYSGSLLIYKEGGSALDSAVESLNMIPSPIAFHRDRSLDRSCLSSTLPTLARWLLLVGSTRISTPTTNYFTSGDHEQSRWFCVTSCRTVSRTLFVDVQPSTVTEHEQDGSALRDIVNTSQMVTSSLILIKFNRFFLLVISASMWTMKFRRDVAHVAASRCSALRQVRSIRRSLSFDLVSSLVHSRLDCCNVVFAGLPLRDLQRLQTILNASVRLVACASKYDHVTPLLRDRHCLPIAERVEYKLCTLSSVDYTTMHRHISLTSFDQLRLLVGDLAYGSLMRCLVDVPRTRILLGDRTFSVAGPRAWNSLPLNVRSSQSMLAFRKLLKSHLFQRAYQ